MFTISGIPIGSLTLDEVSVTWDEGWLSGNAGVMAAAQRYAQELEGQDVGPHEGPYTRGNHLDSPLSAGIILSEQFIQSTISLIGDVPERPAIPADAIG